MTQRGGPRAFAAGGPGFSAGAADALLPGQQPRRHQSSPETVLAVAVLENAIECLRDRRSDRGRAYREAEEWYLAGAPDWPFSFERICTLLDLDPDGVRRALGVAPGPL